MTDISTEEWTEIIKEVIKMKTAIKQFEDLIEKTNTFDFLTEEQKKESIEKFEESIEGFKECIEGFKESIIDFEEIKDSK